MRPEHFLRRMSMEITRAWLEEKGACADGITWFDERGLEGVELEDLMGILMVEHGDWASWLAGTAGWSGVLDYVLPDGTRNEEYYERGQTHREGGPAVVETRSDGYRREEYYERDQMHREGGPAVIYRDAATGTVTLAKFFRRGRVQPKIGPRLKRNGGTK